MKRTLAILSLLTLGAFGMPSTADAGDWNFRAGFGPRGGSVGVRYDGRRRYKGSNYYRRGHGGRHHSGYDRPYRRARHAYRSHRTWIAPVYRNTCVGYDRCGAPIYRPVCVRRGYWNY